MLPVPHQYSSLTVACVCPQEFSFQVDGAQNLRVLVVLQPEVGKSCEDRVLGKTSIQLDPALLQKRWRRQTVSLGQVVVTLSLKYYPHPLDRPSLAPAQQQSIFCMPIGAVAQQEGVLVPHVVRCCVEEVERRGMEEVGIYRLSAATSDMNNLKTAFNTNLREAVSRLRCVDVNAVSGILKLYFRELPEPLIPTELFQSFTKALGMSPPHPPQPTHTHTHNSPLIPVLFLSVRHPRPELQECVHVVSAPVLSLGQPKHLPVPPPPPQTSVR
uniref:Rho-GAP domain-containing protein n=1 Tax=Hucho hucho TaxID=62062 RepID=A0A4W5KPP1_9TELE